jgi:hypothetical protein
VYIPYYKIVYSFKKILTADDAADSGKSAFSVSNTSKKFAFPFTQFVKLMRKQETSMHSCGGAKKREKRKTTVGNAVSVSCRRIHFLCRFH